MDSVANMAKETVYSSNARSWLEHINPLLHSGTEAAALTGIELGPTL
jgi:hypothetical protein